MYREISIDTQINRNVVKSIVMHEAHGKNK